MTTEHHFRLNAGWLWLACAATMALSGSEAPAWYGWITASLAGLGVGLLLTKRGATP